MSHARLRRRPFLLLVLVNEHEAKDQEDQELEAVGNEQGADAELVPGCLAGEVEEGRNDVADACACGCDFLRFFVSQARRCMRTACVPNQIIPDTIIFLLWPPCCVEDEEMEDISFVTLGPPYLINLQCYW